MAQAILTVLDRQEKVVLSRLTGAKARKHTRHWDGVPGGEVKALDATYVLDRARWVGEIVAAVTELVAVAFTAGGSAVLRALGRDTAFDPPGRDRIVAETVQVIAASMDKRWGRLTTLISEMDQAGEPMDRIADAVRDAFAGQETWADTASRAVVGAMNAASLIGATESGAAVKRWLSVDDPRVRDTHRDAEGQTRTMMESFVVGDVALAFPGDPSGGPSTIHETVNCRCSLIFQLPERTPDMYDLELDSLDLD